MEKPGELTILLTFSEAGRKKKGAEKSSLSCEPSEKDNLFGNVCWQTLQRRAMIKILNFKHTLPIKSDIIVHVKCLD